MRLSGSFGDLDAMIKGAQAPKPEEEAMWWLIWIALMLLTPVLAGIRVWLQLRQEAAQAARESTSDSQVVVVASGLLDK